MKNRIVIKIGSRLVTAQENLQKITEGIASFHNMENDVVIVSSGAIATGIVKLDLKKRPSDLPSKQAAASIGQVGLMNKWAEEFSRYNISVAQILLTKNDFEDRNRYLNTRNTILKLLSWSVIPIINENDTVATEEINFGDNDTLSAVVASKTDADCLIIYTDVDGLYKGNPKKDKDAELVFEVKKISGDIESYATGDKGCGFSVGGMESKIEAAKIATASGIEVFITNGTKNTNITDIISGRVKCTRFLSNVKIDGRKKWIAFGAKISGKIIIDDGAANALKNLSKSLLPSGIISVEGDFEKGDVVNVVNNKSEIARGIVSYSCEDIKKIKGHKSSEIEKILCHKDYDEIIHKDNLVIVG
ncbi:MAG: glutamate 5-kinase [Elusimicrobia bacterium RIFOXYC2_FULL_34_12]|nr:MAG: glutamate 5-kinase [Elusimicrobia bacterium RIFOXYC2_FULL_34_12]OGS38912.1 MAG: glutamate 5-kinase [Elusimicrobia bacterium RIFOXYD2_FULL_34_30]HAM39027.1 glutamate 5-kinase [Elusimicrobiota bacterium]